MGEGMCYRYCCFITNHSKPYWLNIAIVLSSQILWTSRQGIVGGGLSLLLNVLKDTKAVGDLMAQDWSHWKFLYSHVWCLSWDDAKTTLS